jgi:hydrogenase maturation protease
VKAAKESKPVILCLGNADRGDDAQGPCCADLLARRGIPVRMIAGNAFELMDYFRAHPHVIIIDAIVSGSQPPGHLHRFDGPPSEVAAFAPSCSTHGFGLGEALRLGAVLKALPQRLTIFGIESASFEWGSAPSPEVTASMESLAAVVAAEWEAACAQ